MRRFAVTSALALVATLCLFAFPTAAQSSAAPSTITTCYLLFGSLDDLGYTYSHNLGRITAHKRLSVRFPNTEIRSVSQPGAFFMNHSEVLQGFVDRGCSVIHATASGFADSIRPFVFRYPNITFSIQNGFWQLPYAPNIVNYAARNYKPWYVAGRVAGREARTAVGFIAAWAHEGEVISAVNAFADGVWAENPTLPVHVVPTQAWWSPPKELLAVRMLRESLGCDVVGQYTDSFVAAQYANGRTDGMFSVQMHGIATRFYGDAVLTCVYSDWSSIYEEIEADRINGHALPVRNYIFSDAVAQLCDVSSRAASTTLRFANDFNVTTAPAFSGWTDSAIRNITTFASGIVQHTPMPDPDAHCAIGNVFEYVVNASSSIAQPRCVPCPENTKGTADRAACSPCEDGLIADAGSASCRLPPAPGVNTGAIVGGVLGAIAVVGIAFVVLAAVQSKRMAAAVRDTTHAPRQSPCTLVFTDVEQSTMLWSDAPDAMAHALEIHNAHIRDAIAAHKCYEVKTAGDSFMIACPDVATAVRLCVQVEKAMLRQEWSPELPLPLRVRMGFAHGEVEVVFDEYSKGYDYFGTTVNLAARCEAAADGGQVFMPNGTLTIAAANELGVGLSEPFERDLRGFDEPVRLVELDIPEVTTAYAHTRKGLYLDSNSNQSAASHLSHARSDEFMMQDFSEADRHPLVVQGTLSRQAYLSFHGVLTSVLQQTFQQMGRDDRQRMAKQLAKATGVKRPPEDTRAAVKAIATHVLAVGRYHVMQAAVDRAVRDGAMDAAGLRGSCQSPTSAAFSTSVPGAFPSEQQALTDV
uniref:Guanylate cyclase domain-containing protein n=1 Tax=Neobodo designis TaxID=312471 RepID=A0A7S1QMF1_NEODS|mmetsp:Transcript_48667/g.150254  ORF Transcript_48667/g.150254 Transcript_48667/m.150254 type:complete len:810 (+) Transcript_48667:67-2496(+)